jgi:hypothetical protein
MKSSLRQTATPQHRSQKSSSSSTSRPPKALGLTIPETLLATADEVIE